MLNLYLLLSIVITATFCNVPNRVPIRTASGEGHGGRTCAARPYGRIGSNSNKDSVWRGAWGTTGNIIADTIEDNVYRNGILLSGYIEPFQTSVFPTKTFLCSDYLAHLHPPKWYLSSFNEVHIPLSALHTSYYDGYVKLSSIYDCEGAYYASGDGNSKLVFDTIDSRNTSDTFYYHFPYDDIISVDGNTLNVVDLSGVHGGGNDVAGFNTVRSYRRSRPMLLMGATSLINLGNSLALGGEPFSNYGENNIFADSVVYDTSFAVLIGSVTSSVYIGNIDKQFWGTGINPANGTGTCAPACKWNSIDTFDDNAENITYDIPDSTSDTLIVRPFSEECGDSRASNHKKGEQPQSVEQPDSTSYCMNLFNEILSYNNDNDYQDEYDSGKYLVEHCPCFHYTPGVFNFISDAVASLSGNNNDCNIFNQYMQWLESVLYLCPTEAYFCGCIQEMGFVYCPNNTGPTGDSTSDAKLAILKWIIQNDTSCANQGQIQQEYNTLLSELIQMWQEDSAQGIHYPLDTTLPSLHSLGLDTLFAKHSLYLSVSEPPQPGILSNASASPNPVTSGTVIYFSIAKEAYVKINLYDVLGHEVGSTAFESLFEPGNYDIPIGMQSLVPGTYFARITTAYGEAETVKLVKE